MQTERRSDHSSSRKPTSLYANAGNTHLYLDYTREHRTKEGENPAGRLLLFTEKDIAKAHYALGNLTNKAIALEYEVILPEAATHSGRTDSIRRSIGQRSLEKNSTASGPDAPLREQKLQIETEQPSAWNSSKQTFLKIQAVISNGDIDASREINGDHVRPSNVTYVAQ